MRTTLALLSSALLAFAVAIPCTARSAPAEIAAGATGAGTTVRVLIGVRDGAALGQRSVAEEVARLGGVVGVRYAYLPYLAAEVPAQAIDELRRFPAVTGITEDRLRRPALLRTAPQLAIEAARRAGLDGRGWVIALPDTGIDARHPFLEGRLLAEYCASSSFAGNAAQPATESLCPGGAAESSAPGAGAACTEASSDCEHGTHVAGLIAGRGGPDGLEGIAPGAGLISAAIYSRLEDGGIAAWDSDLLRALERVHALRNEHRIAAVNLSLAGDNLFDDPAACAREQPALQAAVELLARAGIATVAAAGNDGATDALSSPACIPRVISVGATCSEADGRFCAAAGAVAGYSNLAPFLSLLAPGGPVTSSVRGGYEAFSGTSMAAAQVAGSLALLRQIEPQARLERLREQLSRPGGGNSANPTRLAPQVLAPSGGTRSRAASTPSAMIAAGLPAPAEATAISAGATFTCALTGAGGVRCWGSNLQGAIGDDSDAGVRSEPVDVVGLSSGVVAVHAGGSFVCALTSGGGVKCWGFNASGQLGDGTTTQRNLPVDVMGLTSGVIAVATGQNHACALTAAGGVKCWGANGSGRLGDGTNTTRLTPVDVVGLASGVVAIDAGLDHSCALTAAGGVKCWGENFFGQVGDGTNTDRLMPVDVVGLASGVAAISTGDGFTCALTAAGGVKCWGSSVLGELGDGTNVSKSSPVNVIGLASGVTQIAAGGGHACALNGVVKCWGANAQGELGDGTQTARSSPVEVLGLPVGLAAISVGGDHSCALRAAGGLWCWGVRYAGQMGDGVSGTYAPPSDVFGFASGVTDLAIDGNVSCAVVSGAAKCWGENSGFNGGLLGDGTTTTRRSPVDVVGLGAGVTSIRPGQSVNCAVVGGGARCWGSNAAGQVGDGTQTQRLTPVNVTGLASGVAQVATGNLHACALTTGGGVKCWGNNSQGQVGDGSATINILTPVDVAGLASGVAAITAGAWHVCALTTGGAVKCWGRNLNGEIGDGTATSRKTPVDVVGLGSGVVKIHANDETTCAVTSSGGVKCWGSNANGEIGDGTTINRSTPVDVAGLASGIASVALGRMHACALTTTGMLKCWGRNDHGELGLNSVANRLTPVDVPGLPSGLLAVAAGTDHSCVLTATGGLLCFGQNFVGQLGDNVPIFSTAPIAVLGFADGISPDPFGFTSQTGVAQGSTVTSNTVTPVGYGNAAPISVANGSYSIGCTGTFTMAAGSITPGQSVCVRHTASASPSTTVTTTLTIGGVAGTFSSTTGTGPAPPPLSFTPDPLDFDGQSMFTRSLKRQVTISNVSGGPLTLNSLMTSGPFAVASHTCGSLPAVLGTGASCTADLTFTPPDEGPFAGSLDAATSAGAASGELVGVGERSLVTHYYGAILSRYPEPSGKSYWNSEAARVQGLGADLNEVWYALAIGFFSSSEYTGFNRSDGQFVDDLYRTFLNREPDGPGQAFWLGQFSAGLTREVVLVAFMFSPEFRAFTASIFGDTSVRRELDAVMDFYRGLLFRLPDGGGFNFWVQRFRTAQCAGSAAVTAEAEAISGEFARGAEYANRNRTNSEYVGDLYNAILRRGGDGPGVQFWIGSIASGTLTREQVRQQFVQSPEFQGRVQQIIAAGCLAP